LILILKDIIISALCKSSNFHSMKQRVEKNLTGLELKLESLNEDKSPYKEYIFKPK